eukprot:CAMPEP_0197021910 /NCGR_PEP_ID=MMETSP1384-20130603/2797_1 /TAXON_ID=29189 /ORGANISM="Ammonia sp." /LENGTH=179 /DNA_ID=CAMNT_0042449833 /DNA_START=29 /DNA_END=568 /DNA_ORIENTATION=+
MGAVSNCLYHFANFLMFAAGIAVIVVAAVLAANNETFPEFIITIDIAIVCGVLIMILSFIACFAGYSEIKCVHITFLVMLIITLIVEVIVIVCIVIEAQDDTRYAELQWNSWSAAEKEEYMDTYNCEGFEDHGKNNGYVHGCSHYLEIKLHGRWAAIGMIGGAMFVYQLFLTCYTANKF